MTYDLDPDVVRWGLHLIDVCSLANNGSAKTMPCYMEDSSKTDTLKEDFCSTMESMVENDEVIARALQEELSSLANAEASGYLSSGGKQQKASILAQDWLVPSGRHLNSESQDSVIDDELEKRLNQLVPVPHVLKTNGDIPTADEATSDHERLLNRLQLYNLVEIEISGDGNCQFRSLSDQIYRTDEYHTSVREEVVNQLKLRPDLYENYVPMPYGAYIRKMNKNGEWGDHVTLQAAADWFGVKIFVVTSFKDTCYIEILPQTDQKSNRTIYLSFWSEVHYNSIYPVDELHLVESKKKKRWSGVHYDSIYPVDEWHLMESKKKKRWW